MESFKESLKVNIYEVQEEKLTEEQAKKFYQDYVAKQEKQFVVFINYLNQYIKKVKKESNLIANIQIRARIKTVGSALKNYKIKALNDVFGVEIVCENEEDLKILQDRLEEILNVTKIKIHNKSNGYRAIHHSCTMKNELINTLNTILNEKGIKSVNDDLFPLIEVQYKTSSVYGEANLGKANHQIYKKVEASQVKKIEQLYQRKQLKVGDNIPCMWISDLNDNEMKKMTTEEILRCMYPSIQLEGEKSFMEK